MQKRLSLRSWLEKLVIDLTNFLSFVAIVAGVLFLLDLISISMGIQIEDGLVLSLGIVELTTQDVSQVPFLWVLSVSWILLGLGVLLRERLLKKGRSAHRAGKAPQAE